MLNRPGCSVCHVTELEECDDMLVFNSVAFSAAFLLDFECWLIVDPNGPQFRVFVVHL